VAGGGGRADSWSTGLFSSARDARGQAVAGTAEAWGHGDGYRWGPGGSGCGIARWLLRELGHRIEGEVAVLRMEASRTFETTFDAELLAGSNPRGSALGDLQPRVLVADGQVSRDGAGHGVGEQTLQVGGPGKSAVNIPGVSGPLGEPLVPVEEVDFLEEPVAPLKRGDASDTSLRFGGVSFSV